MSSNHRTSGGTWLAVVMTFTVARGFASRELIHTAESVGCRAAEELSLPRLASRTTGLTPGVVDDVAAGATDSVGNLEGNALRGPGAAESDVSSVASAQDLRIQEGLGVGGSEETLKLARSVITDSAAYRRNILLARLEQLAASGRELLPNAKAALVARLTERLPVIPHAKTMLEAHGHTGSITDAAASDIGGGAVVLRDVAHSPQPMILHLSIGEPGSPVYFDPRLSIGRDGLLADTGGGVARWPRLLELTIDDLNSEWIGKLHGARGSPVNSHAASGPSAALGRMSQAAATETTSFANRRRNEADGHVPQ
jgi:hypothetical protein